MSEFVSQAEFGRQMKYSRPYVTKLKAKGLLVMKGKTVDVEASKRKIEESADPARSAFTNGKKKSSPASYQDAKRIEAVAKAGLKQLEFQREQGKVIDAEKTRQAISETSVTIKTRILAIPNKSAQEIAHLVLQELVTLKKSKSKKKPKTSLALTAAVQEILRKECHEALLELSRMKV